MNTPTCLLILGMHRSGTSALTRVLSIAGAKLPNNILEPSKGNEIGHWEPASLIDYHDRLLTELDSSWDDWHSLDINSLSSKRREQVRKDIREIVEVEYGDASLFVLKDPRICRFAPIIIELLEDAGINVCPILPLRNPLEVCESLAQRDGMSLSGAALLWLRHVIDAESVTRNHSRHIVTYRQLLEDWSAVFKKVCSQFEIEGVHSIEEMENEVSEFLSIGHCHHTREIEDVFSSPILRDWVGVAYESLLTLAKQPDSRKAMSELDRIAGEIDRASPVISGLADAIRADCDEKLGAFKATLETTEEKVVALEDTVSETQNKADYLYKSLAERDKEIESLNTSLNHRETQIDRLKNTITTAEERAVVQLEQLSDFQDNTERLKKTLVQREKELEFLHKENNNREDRINSLETSLREKSNQLEIIGSQYKDSEQQLQIMKISKSWRITAPLRRLADIYKYRSFKTASSQATRNLLEQMVKLPKSGTEQSQLSEKEIIELCSGIKFEQHSRPEISIIVPVYNQIEYTINCLRSLMAQNSPYSFEVIIMDDCSPDSAIQHLNTIEGLRYYKNQNNLGFLRNCNRGADLAHGTYLVFLNNDTLVDTNWLSLLRQTFDSHKNVGLVGSKLVYPDGRLQEAGGIVWQDASAWNWGHSQDPEHPRYNYVRDVDYVSGASIMIEKDFFERLNKFDERYLPAYYEDTDLCFSIRAAGMRVIYQPASIVVHFEGVSSGTDLTTGVKQYQVANKDNFYDKWQEVLKDNLANAETPEIASDRCPKGHILIIDACTPTPDQDSGSLDMFNLIRILIDQGFRVHFMPYTNFAHFGCYTGELQQMGVECIYAPHYKNSKDYLKENGSLFGNVILSRVSIADETIVQVKQYCEKAKVIFYTVDLHFLREQREAELSGNTSQKKLAEETRRKELAIMDKSDTTIVLSEIEKLQLEKLGKTNIELVPLIRDIKEFSVSPFEARSGVLFIGGYQHTPNVDAVDWLVNEIWPQVRKLVKQQGQQAIPLHIYGSQMPDRFKEIPDEDINAHGYVENLAWAFDAVRLSLAPLRYGAGLKGKIATSLEQGVPAVGSTLAFEGMASSGLDEIKVCADNAEDMARAIVDLYYSNERWNQVSDAGKSYVMNHYSIEKVAGKVAAIVSV